MVPLAASMAVAAPNEEITVVPLGDTTIKKGVQNLSFRLSGATQGQRVQPVVLIGAQPFLPPPAGDAAGPGPQTPATLSIEINSQSLPDWILSPGLTGYVINVETIRSNPEFASGRLSVKMHLKSDAEALAIGVLAMPDPVLVDGANATRLNGPLADFARLAPRADARAYFESMIDEFAGQTEKAMARLRELCNSDEADVARFARRSARRLAYLHREVTLSGNLLEHYRWGLYLQFCGLYRPAYDEFEECRVIHAPFADAQFRAAECFEMIGCDLIGLLPYIDRCEAASPMEDVTRLDVLAVILRSAGGATLADNEVAEMMDHLIVARKMIAAATANALRVDFTVRIVDSEADLPMRRYADGCVGPAPEKLERAGWFDGVLTILPSATANGNANVRVAPCGVGPLGATVASCSQHARWPEYMEIAYEMVVGAGRMSGAIGTLPSASNAVGVGMSPSPHIGFSCRSALRYATPRDAYAGVGITDLPLAESYVRAWRLDGPFPATSQDASDDVFSGLPVSTGAGGVAVVADDAMARFDAVTKSGAKGRLRATTWAYTPSDRLLQLRTDQRSPLGVRVNGRVVRPGVGSADALPSEPRAVFSGVRLRRGWNTIEFVTSARGDAASFKASLLSIDAKPIGGFAVTHTRPDAHVVAPETLTTDGSRTFKWDDVRMDWRRELPLLDISAATQAPGLKLTSQVDGRDGFIAIELPGAPTGRAYRAPPTTWNAATDRDVAFNNVMDWRREWCLGLDCASNGKRRQLLFVRPEGAEAIARCLKEDATAKDRFAGLSPADRLIGRIEIPGGDCRHDLLVFDMWLGAEGDWPIEEEDLLSPFGDFVSNADFAGIEDSATPPNPMGPDGPLSMPGG